MHGLDIWFAICCVYDMDTDSEECIGENKCRSMCLNWLMSILGL